MILEAILTTSLILPWPVVPVAIDREPLAPSSSAAMSFDQKQAAVQPLVSSATECIARTVSADPRFSAGKGGVEFNSLIVESVPFCAEALRSMIDIYDRIYGAGAGQTFFTGPYLDRLPEAVTERFKNLR